MTRFLSRWRRTIRYESLSWFESESVPGVSFSLRKMSLSQRIGLSSRVRELTLKNEFLRAGELGGKMDAALADLMVQQLYLEWAVDNIRGLTIDGKAGSLALLIERGPEDLVNEIADAIATQLQLSDSERKNC